MHEEQINLPLVAPPAKSHPISRGIGAFSAVHFPYSIVSLFLVQAVYSLLVNLGLYRDWVLESFPVFLCTLALMVPYFLLGLLMGCFEWSRVKSRQELVCTTLSQAAIAWGWAAVILLLLASLETEPLFWNIVLSFLAPLLPITLFLAFPSCMLVLTGAALAGETPLLAMACWAVPAGLLPPLLFNLGNFLISCKKSRAVPTPEAVDTPD